MTQPPQTPGLCNQCLYWESMQVGGRCHFNPPQVFYGGGEGRTFWPRTLPTDWCGQWSAAALERTVQAVDGA